MPLIKGKSDKAFKENVRTEMHAGKPQKQSLAIAYSMKRKAMRKKYADAGYVEPTPTPAPSLEEGIAAAGRKANQGSDTYNQDLSQYAKHAYGGDVHKPGSLLDEEKIMHELKNERTSHSNYNTNPDQFFQAHVAYDAPAEHEDDKRLNQHGVMDHGPVPVPREDEYDLVDRIMSRKSKDFSSEARLAEGGMADSPNWGAKGWQHEKDYTRGVHKDITGKGESWAGEKMRKGFNQSSKDTHWNKIDEAREMPNPKLKGLAYGGELVADSPYEDDEQDLVDRIMHKHSPSFSNEARLAYGGYSEGGRVANQEHGPMDSRLAGFDQNEFDDLSLRDDLESTYGEDNNAGDENDNEGENERRRDIVSRIMASRRKKDRLPSPA